MVNKSGVKGSRFEVLGLQYLRSRGFIADRLARAGINDEGDLWFIANGIFHVVEAKALRSFDLAAAVTELAVERENFAKARGLKSVPGVALIKRPNKSIEDAYVVLPFKDYLDYLEGKFNGDTR